MFCKIAAGKSDKLEFEDEHCVIVTDLKSLDERKRTAKAHFQCIPKRHIRDILHLKASDEKLIKHMEYVSMRFMCSRFPDNEDGYRQGFHKPPFNTKFHLHMHCIVLPLTHERHERTCNFGLSRID